MLVRIYYILILISFLITFGGCNQSSNLSKPNNVYLVNVKSDDCPTTDKFFNYENDTVQVVYIFWAEKGSMEFLIHNKLKKPLYIDWRKCSYIIGTTKHDYWTETISVTTSSRSNTISNSSEQSNTSTCGNFSNFNLFRKSITTDNSYSLFKTFFNSVTILTKPERVTFIPPGTTISMSNFSILGNNTLNISKKNYSTLDTTIAMKGYYEEIGNNIIRYIDSTRIKAVNLSYINYNSDSTPYTFRSFLTYSTDENFSSESYINNSFFISRIIIMPINIFLHSRKIGETIESKNYNMWVAPNSFYFFR